MFRRPAIASTGRLTGFAIFVVVLFLGTLAQAQTPRILGYYPDWGSGSGFGPDNIDYTQVTHLAWAFVIPDTNGGLAALSAANSKELDTLVKRAHAHGVKVVASLGGGSGGTAFPRIAARDSLRAKFAGQVKKFLAAHALDGADLDWEPPTQADTASLRKMVRSLRDSLGPSQILSMAVYCSSWYGRWQPVERFVDALDWIGVMTYDITGSWDSKAGYNSPLFSNLQVGADWSYSQGLDYWAGKGIPKSKILGGIATYGIKFPQSSTPGQKDSSGTATELTYRTIASNIRGGTWNVHWDSVAQVPWAAIQGGGYATWDDPRSVGLKGHWTADHGFGGAIVWEMTMDWSSGIAHPLVDSLARSLRAGNSSVSERTLVAVAIVRRGSRLVSIDGPSFQVLDVRGRRLAVSRESTEGQVVEVGSLRGWVVARTRDGQSQAFWLE